MDFYGKGIKQMQAQQHAMLQQAFGESNQFCAHEIHYGNAFPPQTTLPYPVFTDSLAATLNEQGWTW